jgi:hypothetical protein
LVFIWNLYLGSWNLITQIPQTTSNIPKFGGELYIKIGGDLLGGVQVKIQKTKTGGESR